MLKIKTMILFMFFFTIFVEATPLHKLKENEIQNVSKFYKKYLRKSCHSTDAGFSQKHTQQEWINIHKKNKFIDELFTLCPYASSRLIRVIKKKKNSKNFQNLIHFCIEYAKDSNNYPQS